MSASGTAPAVSRGALDGPAGAGPAVGRRSSPPDVSDRDHSTRYTRSEYCSSLTRSGAPGPAAPHRSAPSRASCRWAHVAARQQLARPAPRRGYAPRHDSGAPPALRFPPRTTAAPPNVTNQPRLHANSRQQRNTRILSLFPQNPNVLPTWMRSGVTARWMWAFAGASDHTVPLQPEHAALSDAGPRGRLHRDGARGAHRAARPCAPTRTVCDGWSPPTRRSSSCGSGRVWTRT